MVWTHLCSILLTLFSPVNRFWLCGWAMRTGYPFLGLQNMCPKYYSSSQRDVPAQFLHFAFLYMRQFCHLHLQIGEGPFRHSRIWPTFAWLVSVELWAVSDSLDSDFRLCEISWSVLVTSSNLILTCGKVSIEALAKSPYMQSSHGPHSMKHVQYRGLSRDEIWSLGNRVDFLLVQVYPLLLNPILIFCSSRHAHALVTFCRTE